MGAILQVWILFRRATDNHNGLNGSLKHCSMRFRVLGKKVKKQAWFIASLHESLRFKSLCGET